MLEYEHLLHLLSASAETLKLQLSDVLDAVDIDSEAIIACLIHPSDIVSGLLLLCDGSMDSKLSIAFSILDSNDDGMISKRECWRLLRSFLCIVYILQRQPQSLVECVQVRTAADDTSVTIASQVFATAGIGCTAISLNDLLQWYSSEGYNLMDFEFANLFDTIDSPQKRHFKGNFDFDLAHTSNYSNSSAVIFHGYFSNGREFLLTAEDGHRIRNLLEVSYLYSYDLAEVVHLLHCLKSSGGCITHASLKEFLFSLLPTHESEDDRLELATSIAYLLYGDSSDDSVLPFPTIAAGLTILCHGSKSAKLSLGFQLFDTDSDGKLNESELQLFLSSYLHVLVYCSQQASNGTSREDNDMWVESVCEDIASSVFAMRTEVDFATFSEYYNTGGYKEMGWIELIDVSKWTALERHVSFITENLVLGSEVDDDQSMVATIKENVAFTLSVRSDEDVRTKHISKSAAANVYVMSASSGLIGIKPEDLYASLNSIADDGLVTLNDFRECSLNMLEKCGSNDDESAIEECLSYLEIIFLAMDITEEGYADLSALVCALCIPCYGDKSDKLAFCYRLFCDNEGYMTRRGLYQMLRSIYWSIWTLSLCDDTANEETEIQQESLLMDSTILSICTSIEDVHHTQKITFDDIAHWYADEGFKVAPWLELLDLNKWMVLAS